MEAIEAEQVQIDKTYVKKVDIRGSIVTAIPSGKNDNLPLLEYK